jgi:hypothetical protein
LSSQSIAGHRELVDKEDAARDLEAGELTAAQSDVDPLAKLGAVQYT